ncbi:MAG: DUF4293 domain-containing protein [Bacteroidota bacterium]
MIQRIQSIWLLLAGLFILFTFKHPFYVGTNAAGIGSYELLANENFIIAALTIITGVLALFNIALFKKRKLQLWLCIAGIVLEAILIFLYYKETKTFIIGSIALWALFHIAAILCFLLAAKGISNDEKLIRDSDRLR